MYINNYKQPGETHQVASSCLPQSEFPQHPQDFLHYLPHWLTLENRPGSMRVDVFLFSQAELLVFPGPCRSLFGTLLEFLCQGHHYLHNNTDFYTLDGEPVGCSAVWSEILQFESFMRWIGWFGLRVIWQRTWGHAAGEGGPWWFDRMIYCM